MKFGYAFTSKLTAITPSNVFPPKFLPVNTSSLCIPPHGERRLLALRAEQTRVCA